MKLFPISKGNVYGIHLQLALADFPLDLCRQSMHAQKEKTIMVSLMIADVASDVRLYCTCVAFSPHKLLS